MLKRLTAEQKREVGDTANVILSLIDRMKRDAPQLPRSYSKFEAHAYSAHGRIALSEGTEEGARKAVVHFENQLEVYNAIGFSSGIAAAKCNIAAAKSIYEGGNSEDVLKISETSQEYYELRVAKHGEDHRHTIGSGRVLAIALLDANRGDEARELLTKLLATSKQVFGPDHNITKKVTSKLKRVIAELSSRGILQQYDI
jgi:hypothetical protein